MPILDTASGRKLDLDDPQPDQICLEDLASALSKVCRFGADVCTVVASSPAQASCVVIHARKNMRLIIKNVGTSPS